jgi:hypothetical protein
MSKKGYVYGFSVGLALFIVVGVAASRLQQLSVDEKMQRADVAEYAAELPGATPVQLGVLTAKQRTHSKLYAHYLDLTKTFTASKSIAEAKSKVVVIDISLGMGPAFIPPETPEDYLGALARGSDVVIRGRVVNKDSQITENDGFVFTDYGVLVAEVLKNDKAASLDKGMTITVTRPGGTVLVGGIILKGLDHSFLPLPDNGHDLLLFLKHLPDSDAFCTTESTGSFELDDSSLRPLTEKRFPVGVLLDANSFLRTTRAVTDRLTNK